MDSVRGSIRSPSLSSLALLDYATSRQRPWSAIRARSSTDRYPAAPHILPAAGTCRIR